MAKQGGVAVSIVLGASILYLAGSAVGGQQGLLAYVDLQEQERDLTARLHTLEAEQAGLEARAARMRPETLDLDYLDERARITLAAGNPDEIVVALDGATAQP